jgi:hypothetical protein
MPRRAHQRDPLFAFSSRAGDAFGAIASVHLLETYDDFVREVVNRTEVCCFVVAVLDSWRRSRERRTVDEVRMAVRWGRTHGWVRQALQAAYGIYCLFRSSAVPRAQQPDLGGEHSLHVSRRLHRVLRTRGSVLRRLARRAPCTHGRSRGFGRCGVTCRGCTAYCGWTTTSGGGSLRTPL